MLKRYSIPETMPEKTLKDKVDWVKESPVYFVKDNPSWSFEPVSASPRGRTGTIIIICGEYPLEAPDGK